MLRQAQRGSSYINFFWSSLGYFFINQSLSIDSVFLGGLWLVMLALLEKCITVFYAIWGFYSNVLWLYK